VFVGLDVTQSWADSVLNREAPKLYRVGEGAFERFEFGPGSMVLLGGSPGSGKSSLALQMVYDALRIDTGLRALYASVEIPHRRALDRQLARIATVEAQQIHHRSYAPECDENVRRAMDEVKAVSKRVVFLEMPFSCESLSAIAAAYECDIVCCDYIQRTPPYDNSPAGTLESIGMAVQRLRELADSGKAVLNIAAMSRPKDGEGVSIHSFRGSSELEYGHDDCFSLETGTHPETAKAKLKCWKHRYGSTGDGIDLVFHKKFQRFDPQ